MRWTFVMAALLLVPSSAQAEEEPRSSRRSAQGPTEVRPVQLPKAGSTTPTAAFKQIAVPKADSGDLGVLVRRTVMATLLAGGLAGALLITVGRSKQGPSRNNGALELVSTLTLAPRCTVSMVRARGNTVLIARDAGGVKQMVVLPEAFDGYLDEGLAQEVAPASFVEGQQVA